jgi:hypothetical protein
MITRRNPMALFLPAALVVTVACLCGITPTPRPELKFDPDALPSAQVGIPYKAIIQVSQNVTPVFTLFVSEGELPGGLTLEYVENDSQARITGTPIQTGTFKFLVTAMCLGTSVSGQTGEKEYLIVVE